MNDFDRIGDNPDEDIDFGSSDDENPIPSASRQPAQVVAVDAQPARVVTPVPPADECPICKTNKPTIAFSPCGHVYCPQCVPLATERQKKKHKKQIEEGKIRQNARFKFVCDACRAVVVSQLKLHHM